MTERLYKVAFTGAGCVGKTTLLDTMREVSPARSVCTVGESARAYFASHPDIPEDERYTFYHQARIQQMAMRLETATYEQTAMDLGVGIYPIGREHVFTDRSVFDAAVCVASTGDRQGARELVKRAKRWVPGESDLAYSQIYVLDPADVPFENDDVRKENEETRQRQHEMFLEFFTDHDITHQLLSGTLDARTEAVLAQLPKPE